MGPTDRSMIQEMLFLAPVGIVMDIGGRINFANEMFAEMSGRSAGDLIGSPWSEVLIGAGDPVPPTDRTASLRLRPPGGGEVGVRVRSRVRIGPEGVPARVSVVEPEPEARNGLPPDPERAAQRVRALLLAYPDLVFRIGADYRFLDCSAGEHESKLFLPPASFLGRRVPDVLPPVLADQLVQSIDLVRSGAPYDSFEYRVERDGAVEIWEARVVASGPNEVIVVSREITSVRQLDDALREAGATERGRIARALHDGLGQQLTGIVIRTSMLEDRLQEDPGLAAEIARVRSDLSRAIDEVRRVSAGLVPPGLERGSLSDALRDLVGQIEHTHGTEVVLDLALPAIADEGALTDLFHLFRDAIFAAVETGRADRISLSARAESARFLVVLEDDGECPLGERARAHYDRIRYRVRRLSGFVVLETASPRGVRMICHLPRSPFSQIRGGA